MRRTLPLLLAATLLIAACSSNDDTATDATDAAETTAGDVATTDTPEGTDPAAPPTNPDKPSVDIPDEIPTELEVTVLEEGSGPEAAPGDTVIVDYVGVRSRDGVEFDNSYDRFQPFDLVLGTGSVIDGWDQGLTGVQAGSTVRIDIPSDLAYGPDANGDIIGENEALTFLIEVRAVIQPPDPADAPTEAGVPESEGAADTTFVDLREGDGPELQPGQTAVVNYVVFRGDNLVRLESSWEGGEPVSIGTAAGTGFPGFVEGLPGMAVGGRRAIVIPPDDAFGPDGNPQMGLPAGTDMIVVIDLLGAFGTPEG
jgi:FKBP-type peptidyl-prolyl cis-trans isomerase